MIDLLFYTVGGLMLLISQFNCVGPTSEKVSVPKSLIIAFTDTSIGKPIPWCWNFGDKLLQPNGIQIILLYIRKLSKP